MLPDLEIRNLLGAWQDPAAKPNHPLSLPSGLGVGVGAQPGSCRTQTRLYTHYTQAFVLKGSTQSPQPPSCQTGKDARAARAHQPPTQGLA